MSVSPYFGESFSNVSKVEMMKQTTLICEDWIEKLGAVHLSQTIILDLAQSLGSWENNIVGAYLYSFPNHTTILCIFLQEFAQGVEDTEHDYKNGQQNPTWTRKEVRL